VILVAAVLRDDALARSLSETYLAPLEGTGIRRRAARNTAAAALAVDRHTVQRRLAKSRRRWSPAAGLHAELVVAPSLEEFELEAEQRLSRPVAEA
jgi:hypothetical protein